MLPFVSAHTQNIDYTIVTPASTSAGYVHARVPRAYGAEIVVAASCRAA
jgi:hypothetical protein